MALPGSIWLAIAVAARRAAEFGAVTLEEAQARLTDAWLDGELAFFGIPLRREHQVTRGPHEAIICRGPGVILGWETGSLSIETLGIRGIAWTQLSVKRVQFETWLGCTQPASHLIKGAPGSAVPPLRPPAYSGPKVGSGRHVASDRRLFPEIDRLMKDEGEGVYGAARRLVDRISGADAASEESRIRRLAKRYKEERDKK